MGQQDLRFIPWPLAPVAGPPVSTEPIGTPRNPDGTPNYAYLDHGEWWKIEGCNSLGVGFVRNERFGSGQVVPGTNRQTSRKWRKIG
jgi:hypothetical protein